MRALRGLGPCMVAVVLACGCGGSDRDKAALQAQTRLYRAKREAMASELALRQRLANSNPGAVGTVSIRLEDLVHAYNQTMPLEVDVGALTSQAEGVLVVQRILKAEWDGNALRFTAQGKARNVRVKANVPLGFGPMVADVVNGLQAGVDMTLRGFLYPADGGLEFMGRCESVRLHKHASENYHSAIRNAVNNRVMRKPFKLAFNVARAGASGWHLLGIMPAGQALVVGVAGNAARTPTPAQPAARTASAPPVGASSNRTATQQCVQVMTQLGLCADISVDMLLDERARINPTLAGQLKDPPQRAQLRATALATLKTLAQQGVTPHWCATRMEGSQVPPAVAQAYTAVARCWDTPCGDRTRCLRGYVRPALGTATGAFLR